MQLSPKAVRLAREHGLNARQAKFWLLFYTGTLPTEAVRQAGYGTGYPGQEAWRLTNNVEMEQKASKWLEELAGDAAAAKGLTSEHVVAMLMREARDCETDGARIRAKELLGKATGTFVDRIEISDGTADQVMAALHSVLPPEQAQLLADQLGVAVVQKDEDAIDNED